MTTYLPLLTMIISLLVVIAYIIEKSIVLAKRQKPSEVNKMKRRISIKKEFVGSPRYTGGRPDRYVVSGGGKTIRVGTKERAIEVANARKRLRAKGRV